LSFLKSKKIPRPVAKLTALQTTTRNMETQSHNWPIALKQPIQVEFTTVIIANLIIIGARGAHGQVDTGKWIIHIRFCERSSRVENGLCGGSLKLKHFADPDILN